MSASHAATSKVVRPGGTRLQALGILVFVTAAFCLDVQARREGTAATGLDAFLRGLWQEFGATGRTYTFELALSDEARRLLSPAAPRSRPCGVG